MMGEEMKEYCYTLEEMLQLLHDSQGRPMARDTLMRKIHTRTGCPPFINPRRGVYYFPKDAYSDWIRKLPVIFEVKGAS